MDALTALLHEDATWSMPPYELWLQAHDDIRAWCLGPGHRLRGSRLVADRGQRLAGVRAVQAGARRAATSRGRSRSSRSTDGRISGITFFLDTARLFPLFGLPARLDPDRSMTARPAITVGGAPASDRRPPPPGAGSPRSRCRRGRSRGRLPARDRPGHGLPLGVGPRGRHEHRGPRPRAVRGATARPDARDAPDDVRRRGRGGADPPGGGLARGRPHGATPEPPARRASRRRGRGRLDARCGGRDARRPRATRRGDGRGARERRARAPGARARQHRQAYEGEIGLASRVLLLLARRGPDRAREAQGHVDQQPVPLDPLRALARRAAGGAPRRRGAGRARPSLARALRARDARRTCAGGRD